MRFLTYSAGGVQSFGLEREGTIVDLGARRMAGAASLRELIAADALGAAMDAAATAVPDHGLSEVELLPTIPDAGKIVCIGVNYGDRNAEYKDESSAPRYPSVFMRTRESLVGHGQPLLRPPESEQLDYEGEIVLVIGRPGRRIAREAAWRHIAGLSLMNEGSVRDWLRHAKFNVTQGKNFASSGALGPWMVSADEFRPDQSLHLTTHVNGELRQDDTTDNLLFPFDYLVAYLSRFMPLNPGDLIATGTPTGAGARFDPPKYLKHGDVVTVEVDGIGRLENRVEDEAA